MNVSFVAVPLNDNPEVLLTCDKLVSMVLSLYKTCDRSQRQCFFRITKRVWMYVQ